MVKFNLIQFHKDLSLERQQNAFIFTSRVKLFVQWHTLLNMHIGFGAGSTNRFPVPSLSVWKKKMSMCEPNALLSEIARDCLCYLCPNLSYVYVQNVICLCILGREQCDSMGFFCGVIRRQLEQQHEAMKRALLCGTSLSAISQAATTRDSHQWLSRNEAGGKAVI